MSTESRRYFAAYKDAELAEKVLSRVSGYKDDSGVRQVTERQGKAWQYFFGFDPEGFHATSGVRRAGEQGELTQVKVNHCRSLANALLNLIVAPKFVWTPRAANIDYDSIQQTKLASSLLEHYWHNSNVSGLFVQAVKSAIAYTEGFIHPEWDEHSGQIAFPDEQGGVQRSGDIKFRNVLPWDVIRDPMKSSWEDLDWVVVRVWRNRFDLAARYPKHAEAILSQNPEDYRNYTVTDPTRMNGDQPDDVPVFYFYHKPCAILPQGRAAKILSSKVTLEDRPLDYDMIPLVRIAPDEMDGTPFGYSPFFEILGIQEMSDHLHLTVASNISTFGVQSIAYQQGTGIRPDEFGGMRSFEYPEGSKPPEALNLVSVPPETFKYLDELKKDQELLIGLNSVVRGEAQSDRMSGSALALLQSQALQQASVLSASYFKAVETLGTAVLRIIKKRASLPLKIGIVGRHKLDLAQETEVRGDMLSNVDQVYVEVGNPISQTSAGRYELAQQLVQMGVVKTPEALQQVLDTGRLEPLTEARQQELTLILRENQTIAQGSMPPALLSDDHMLHVREHTTAVANPQARERPGVLQAFIDHVHEHYMLYYGVPDPVEADPFYRERMLALMGQVPPPPMGLPAPEPGMEGSPDAEGLEPSEVVSPAALGPGQAAEDVLPQQPENPATGQRWNGVDGGGAVPR